MIVLIDVFVYLLSPPFINCQIYWQFVFVVTDNITRTKIMAGLLDFLTAEHFHDAVKVDENTVRSVQGTYVRW